jgi:hypothetical protein
MQNSDERRRYPRYEVSIFSRGIDLTTTREIQCSTHDISLNGIGFSGNKSFQSGAKLDIWLYMPDNGEQIHTGGKVVWTSNIGPDRFRYGVELDNAVLQPIPLVLRTIRMRAKYYG